MVVTGVRVSSIAANAVADALALEAPLQVCLNGRPVLITMRTPGADEALVRGLLFTEGVVSANAPWSYRETPATDDHPVTATVELPDVYVCPGAFERWSRGSMAACGVCGQRDFRPPGGQTGPLPPGAWLEAQRLPGLAEQLTRAQQQYAATGGSHGAAIFTLDGELLALGEDVGRHNAVDKAVGTLLITGRLAQGAVLLVSGRVSYELVAKAYVARLPFLAAVSAPSSLAVECGRRWGVTVIGFCRQGRATVYSHWERVRWQGRPLVAPAPAAAALAAAATATTPAPSGVAELYETLLEAPEA